MMENVMIKKNKINSVIKKRRVELQLSQHDLVNTCHLTESEYRDIEDYEDEMYMVVPLITIECICYTLKIRIDELLGFVSYDDLLPPNIIGKKMEEVNIPITKLSDIVGIEVSYIENIRVELINIGHWTIDPVISLSDVLGLNFGCLLNSFAEYQRRIISKQDKRKAIHNLGASKVKHVQCKCTGSNGERIDCR